MLKAIGMHKPPKSAKRGVVVFDKSGKVLAIELGSPGATVDAVRRVVDGLGEGRKGDDGEEKEEKEDRKLAETAAEVADTAAAIDG